MTFEIFPAQETPRIFGIPPGCNFARALVSGLMDLCAHHPPEALARITVFTNTRRAQRMLEDAFAETGTLLLPRIRVLNDLADDPLPDLPTGPAPSALQQLLQLMPAVLALLEEDPDLAPRASVFDLTQSLLDLGREFEIEGLDLAALEEIDPVEQDLQSHWATSLMFLTLLRDVLADDGTGPDARIRAATQALEQRWQSVAPRDPVLIVGSTGSRGTTRRFMRAVASLPQGALVLPGFEFGVTAEIRAVLDNDPDHPQHGFQALSHALDFAWENVAEWRHARPANEARNRLVSMALRPAPVTDQWLSEGPTLKPELQAATQTLDLVEARDEREEALAIALTLRDAHEEGKSAALITPNRMLARRVTAELGRWGILPDDSGGQPLHLTPPGIFLRLVGESIGKDMHPGDLLRILKHPLCAASTRGAHLAMVRKIETKLFAGGPPVITASAVNDWWAKLKKQPENGEVWIDWLGSCLAALQQPLSGALPDMVERHRKLAEAFAGGLELHADALWDKGAGESCRALLDELAGEGGHVHPLSSTDYHTILRGAMQAIEARPEAFEDTKGVAIWGTLEARIQWADVIVLGGLNEGVWPRLPSPDPWLSRSMRAAVGLPRAERQIGLSAHDFQQACGAPRVVLTRAQRSGGGEPSVPSRWITRLTSLLEGLESQGRSALAEMRARGAARLALAHRLEQPDAEVPAAARPAPCPPLDARPTRLSVTQIETLIRDPYSIYARHVLCLKPLERPGREPDAIERGNVLHRVLEDFWQEYLKTGETISARTFLEVAADVIAREVPWPIARHRWLARLERVADRHVEEELERRDFARPVASEVEGTREMKGLARPFTLSAKADRIDQLSDGRLAIYDYKSGAVSSDREIGTFAKQLPLEAAIAAGGGFKDLPPSDVARLALIGFTATGRHSTKISDDDVRAEEHWQELGALLARYFDENAGYAARLRPQLLKYRGDYDHLSRFGEWTDSEDTDPVRVP